MQVIRAVTRIRFEWMLVIVMAAIVVGLAVVIFPAATSKEGKFSTQEFRLLDPEHVTRISFVYPPEAKYSDYLAVAQYTIQGETRPVLFMHPPASAKFYLQIPPEAKLKFATAINPEAWDKAGDGVDFQVRVTYWSEEKKQDVDELVYSQYLDPKHNPEDQKWNDASVDLSKLKDMMATITLQTLPHDSPDYDWAAWNEPRIEGLAPVSPTAK